MLRYADERAVGGAVSKGTCDVSIPRSHEAGSLESPSWIHLEFRPDQNKHVVLLRVNELASDPFYRQLSERVAGSPQKEVVVFVHGFNNSFEEAARKTAQLTWDLRFDGAPILYSWPSRNSLLKYTEDEDTVQWTAFHLRAFLDELVQRIDPRENPSDCAQHGKPRPDFGPADHRRKTPGKRETSIRSSCARRAGHRGRNNGPAGRRGLARGEADHPVCIRQRRCSHSFQVRAWRVAGGREGQVPADRAGIDTVDASAARTDFMGHAYFDNSVDIITDMQRMFATSAPPEARRLIPALLKNLRYWIIPAAATEGRTR